MRDFIYTSHPQRVVFGAGSLQHLAREIDALGARRALVLSTPEQRGQAERVAEMLGAQAAGIFDRAVMHVPIETAREAREVARKLDADCAVAIGGGSTTGLGKAIALDSGLPILAIPTTYAGSEMTPIYGLTEAGLKKTGKDPRVLPRTVIYDPELSRTLPVGLSVTSGINAIAHAAEGLYAQDSNPVMDLMAQEGIAAIARALPALMRSTVHGSVAPCSAAWAWHCITSFATRWAGASTCRMPKCTPWCCRMRSRSTPRPRLVRWNASRRRLVQCPHHWACNRSLATTARRSPSRTSACVPRTWTEPLISQ
jgi:alcohol dehydrogenase class IV